jgi:mannose-6-phosphate isomerase-like protein (cupin superfamily)
MVRTFARVICADREATYFSTTRERAGQVTTAAVRRSTMDDQVLVANFDEIGWDDFANPGAGSRLPPGMVSAAQRAGVRRTTLSPGVCGFHVAHTEMPPNHVVRTHRHPHDEVFALRRGSITLDGPEPKTLTENDLVVIPANQYYGFTVGPEGVAFLTIRQAATETFLAGPEEDEPISAA